MVHTHRLTFRGRFYGRPLLGPDTNAEFWVPVYTRYFPQLDITKVYVRKADVDDADRRGAIGKPCSVTEHLMATGGKP